MSGSDKKTHTTTSGRVVVIRSRVALGVILVFMFLLVVRFAYLQIFDPKDYRNAALDQYTSSVTIEAKRGAIYANDGTTELAVSATVYNCFISPFDIENDEQMNLIADGLSTILSVDRDEIINKAKNKKSKYQIIKKFMNDIEEDAVRSFISENKLEGKINLEETTKRYYRYSTFAAQLIGFTGSDNQGLTGIELMYDQYLAGIDGKSVKATDAYGKEIDTGVGSTYVSAVDGYNVVTTIDWSIQNTVEKFIKQAYEEHKPNGRVECLVMDVDSGELLASAIYPSYDLNNYTQLNEYYQLQYDQIIGSEEERAAEKSKLLNMMWNNTIATETYEPGSTFKIITSAMALEEGVVSYDSSSFSCSGKFDVAGTIIHCHNTHGHGTQTFSQALVNSCNPAFIQIGSAIGANTFKKYFDEFGYTSLSGADVRGEASTIYYESTGTEFGPLNLAIYSFGQTFKVTPLQHLRAVSAVANGGYLVVPHTVKSLVDNDGNVVKTFEYENDRQVISTETCNRIIKTLTNSTKNASVTGYNIVSKTGTSEKRDTEEDDYISSCVSFAPAEDPQIAILVLVDEPTSGQHFGSAVAAPIVSNILTEVLPHLGIAPNTDDTALVTVPNYKNSTVDYAKKKIEEELGVKCVIRGNGDKVTHQLPASGTVIYNDGVVILYTEGADVEANATVPNLIDKSPSAAIKSLINNNLNVSISGIFNNDFKNCKVITQSVPAGEKVLPGTVIELEFLYEESIE